MAVYVFRTDVFLSAWVGKRFATGDWRHGPLVLPLFTWLEKNRRTAVELLIASVLRIVFSCGVFLPLYCGIITLRQPRQHLSLICFLEIWMRVDTYGKALSSMVSGAWALLQAVMFKNHNKIYWSKKWQCSGSAHHGFNLGPALTFFPGPKLCERLRMTKRGARAKEETPLLVSVSKKVFCFLLQ